MQQILPKLGVLNNFIMRFDFVGQKIGQGTIGVTVSSPQHLQLHLGRLKARANPVDGWNHLKSHSLSYLAFDAVSWNLSWSC